MRFFHLMLLAVGLWPCAVLGLNLYQQSQSRPPLGLADLGRILDAWRHAQERGKNLDVINQQVLDQIQSKNHLIESLIAREISLAETISRIRAQKTAQEWSFFLTQIELHFPGSPEEERLCRYVLELVKERLPEKSKESWQVLAGLENEMGSLLGNDPR